MTDLTNTTAPLGMGCWPIGGAMFHGDTSLGYTGADDAESLRTIHAALEGGITLFDTAAAYGAGHAERLLGKALKDRPEAVIVTKIGIGIENMPCHQFVHSSRQCKALNCLAHSGKDGISPDGIRMDCFLCSAAPW